MTAPLDDYWPSNFATLTEDPAPVAFLREQGKRLAGKTGGRVEGVVDAHVSAYGTTYSLSLRAPRLGDYRYKILDVSIPVDRGPANPYPFCAVENYGAGESLIHDEDEFKSWLRKTLSSVSVANVIGNLLKGVETREED